MSEETAEEVEPMVTARCRHCRRGIHWVAEWWEHVGGTVACTPNQAIYPPRGTNAAP
ncbi:hypothetical protein [Actinocorallia lasiicapitis]